MSKYFYLFYCFVCLSAQYGINDRELVLTNFKREFKPELILSYLNSSDDNRVIAAVLSINHTEDQDYIPLLLKLNFDKFGKYIAFSLGLLGESEKSVEYLLNKLELDSNPYTYDCMIAFGRIASEDDFNKLINLKLKKPSLESFSLALSQYLKKNTLSTNELIIQILKNDLNSGSGTLENDAVYGLKAFIKNKDIQDELISFFLNKHTKISNELLSLTLSALNRISKIELPLGLFQQLSSHDDWRVRVELSKLFSKYPFNTNNEFENYKKMIFDENTNVQESVSVNFMNIPSNIFSLTILTEILNNKKLSKRLKGNVLVSYAKQNRFQVKKLFLDFKSEVSEASNIKLIALGDSLWAFKELLRIKDLIMHENRIEYLNAILSLQDQLINLESYANEILLYLTEDISIISECVSVSLKTNFVHKYNDKIIKIILKQIEKKKDDPAYRTALKEYHNIAKKISVDFEAKYLNILKSSVNDDIKYFVSVKLMQKQTIKPDDMFNHFWTKSFKYEYAMVETTVGSFKFRFKSEYAPITVGNFVYLTEQDFFKNMSFHRVVPNFLSQIGDPTGTGWGKVDYTINTELSPSKVDESYVGMASAGRNTESSHWFLMHGNFPHLYGNGSSFGVLVGGFDIIKMIDQNTRIIDINFE
jgi:cyclophilin family peptidyl-prolyl cis-trans isomerase